MQTWNITWRQTHKWLIKLVYHITTGRAGPWGLQRNQPSLLLRGWFKTGSVITNWFHGSMGGVGSITDASVAADFPWAEMCEGKDGLVDLGGGQGTLCCSLALRWLLTCLSSISNWNRNQVLWNQEIHCPRSRELPRSCSSLYWV